jgi:hypothetical protein
VAKFVFPKEELELFFDVLLETFVRRSCKNVWKRACRCVVVAERCILLRPTHGSLHSLLCALKYLAPASGPTLTKRQTTYLFLFLHRIVQIILAQVSTVI